MHLHRRTLIQLAIFVTVAVVAGAVMFFGYFKAPVTWFGIGQYTVTVELPQAAGLYKSANVTYRGTEVGRVKDIHLTGSGVEAVLSLRSDVPVPSNLQAQVHSVSAVGEQYIALIPRSDSAPLKNGDVITRDNTQVSPDINTLLDATNQGLAAIPKGNLKTVIDESYTAVNGLGPEISRLVKGSTQLAIDARANLNSLTTLIDQSQPVLDSQVHTSDEISAWSAHLATITQQLQHDDSSVAAILSNGPAAAQQARELVHRLQPTVPILLANMVSVNAVAIAYQPSIEQLLVLLPAGTAEFQGMAVPNMNTKQAYRGLYLDFNLNINIPPPCNTGFLPIQQQRVPTFQDAPDIPAGDMYCRIPQDAPITAVRGARNYPCMTVPGKRAPTVKMCESDQNYVPLNDGNNWKGDPNATLSGQGVPQQSPQIQSPPSGQPPPESPPPPLAVVQYDPATGAYIGPDGHVYSQSELATSAPQQQTWQTMLMPQAAN
jgi:phospholipid/cholesterol/gamma-HCH transport system substrate-binding protein